MKNKVPKTSLIAAIFAALIAALCCLGPLLVVLLGLSTAWIGSSILRLSTVLSTSLAQHQKLYVFIG